MGSLTYLVNTTRWDIRYYAVMILTRGMFAPAGLHMAAAERVLRYLRGTPDLPIAVDRRGDLQLTGFTAGDFAQDIVTRRSCNDRL